MGATRDAVPFKHSTRGCPCEQCDALVGGQSREFSKFGVCDSVFSMQEVESSTQGRRIFLIIKCAPSQFVYSSVRSDSAESR